MLPLEIDAEGNTTEDILVANIHSAIAAKYPIIKLFPEHYGHAVIVGGGPSLKDTLNEIKLRKDHGQFVFSTNNTWRILRENGIEPDYHVMLDARIENLDFVPDGIPCLYSSQCHPDVLKRAKNLTIWHCHADGIEEVLKDDVRDTPLVGGGSTVGLKAICLAHILGFREFHIYGMDSSYDGESHHAYSQPLNDSEKVIDIVCNGKKYKASGWMIQQNNQFKDFAKHLVESGCILTVHGYGLLKDTADSMASPMPKTFNAVYDLACSPPTYEFITFLCAAEKLRLEGGYEGINIIFQPGPNGGFRDDALPPDLETRRGMLWRICVAACRLLPAVKNITVLSERKPVDGFVFPVGWNIDNPVSQYGMQLIKDAPRALRPTQKAQQLVIERIPEKYVTMTIRTSPYWPERNSQLDEWDAAAVYIEKMGYRVVKIYETETVMDAFSWDIDLRLALYKGADVNLGVANGPMSLCMLSDIPYIVFRPITEGHECVTKEFMEINGYKEGEDMTPNGKLVWEDDTADVIVREFRRFLSI